MDTYLASHNVQVMVLRPSTVAVQQTQCWWEPRRQQDSQTWCQLLAQVQLNNSRHFIVCQPLPFSDAWSPLTKDDRTVLGYYDRCTCELQDAGRQNAFTPRKERMYLMSACPELLWPFRNLFARIIKLTQLKLLSRPVGIWKRHKECAKESAVYWNQNMWVTA